ncbi:MAG: PilT/PilU family type 4a pilus ATPase [Myxococcaceae bacterium]|nr:PilT/PilU family type 4a pilus ATPase [Myxococcaceae bacterium]
MSQQPPARGGADRRVNDRIGRFLKLMKDWNASDLHLSVGRPPLFRVDGVISEVRYRNLSDGDFRTLIAPITPPHLWNQYEQTGDVDFAYDLPGVSRYRVNLFRQQRGMAAVFRNLSANLVSIDRLNLPEQVHRFVEFRSGLVLVTGPTGSGKSTTLAAIINEMNTKRPLHFITIEDPVEFVHENKKSIVSQREVGTHANGFAPALKAAMRENPDVILVGEMRDLETIEAALAAAETGTLVFGTLHTNSAAKTIDRLISAFPTDRQPGVRNTLASVLRGVLAQQLLRKKVGGRIAAVEVMFSNFAVTAMIREGKTHQISGAIAQGKRDGMLSMDETLRSFVEDDLIEDLDALDKAIDKDQFREFLKEKGLFSEEEPAPAAPAKPAAGAAQGKPGVAAPAATATAPATGPATAVRR